jgi:hypothetical protein
MEKKSTARIVSMTPAEDGMIDIMIRLRVDPHRLVEIGEQMIKEGVALATARRKQ